MFKKGGKLYGIFKLKCPRCHEGDLFVYKNSYKIGGFHKMHEKCEHCGQKFEPETGFYYGAMYVSYALSIVISVATFVAMYFFFNVEIWLYILVNAIVLLLLVPVTFRLARALWINLMIAYDAEAISSKNL